MLTENAKKLIQTLTVAPVYVTVPLVISTIPRVCNVNKVLINQPQTYMPMVIIIPEFNYIPNHVQTTI